MNDARDRAGEFFCVCDNRFQLVRLVLVLLLQVLLIQQPATSSELRSRRRCLHELDRSCDRHIKISALNIVVLPVKVIAFFFVVEHRREVPLGRRLPPVDATAKRVALITPWLLRSETAQRALLRLRTRRLWSLCRDYSHRDGL